MKFSVLMSVYFKENKEYLKDAIESILNQTCKPSEILIVKDGQLGLELDLLIDYYVNEYDGLFKIIQLEKNVGLGNALNIGLKNCKYNLVARMDSDDICRKDRFEKQLEIFRNNENIGIVGSYIDEFDEDINNIISVRKVPITYEEILKYSKRRCPFNHMTVMYKKDIVLKCGNYQELKMNEDYYLWIRMLNSGVLGCNIPESLVYARTGDAMYERRGGLEYVKTDFTLQKKLLSMGYVNLYEFITNSIIRSLTRVFPNKLRKWIYINLLRK